MEAIFGVISPFLTAVLILLIVFGSKYLRDKSKNEVMKKAIENGVELSPDFFKSEFEKTAKTPKIPTDPLTTSLVLIGVGIGVFVALTMFFNDIKYGAFGFIPLFIGLGQLVAYLINKRNKSIN